MFFSPTTAIFAAGVSFTVPDKAYVGEVFEVVVKADSDGEMINSVDLMIDFNDSILEFSGYKSDNGVVKLWVKSPSEKDGVLEMSGIIPGGVMGLYDPAETSLGDIPLVTLMFTAQKIGDTELSFVQSKILKHDGKGTEIEHEKLNTTIAVIESAVTKEDGVEAVPNPIDSESPESFAIIFLDSAFFGRTPSMIVFETTDRISGVREFRMKGVGDTWAVVKSPHPVSKGLFSQHITLRAYDFYGNFEESSVRVPGMVGSKFFWGFIALFMFCLALYKVLKYKA